MRKKYDYTTQSHLIFEVEYALASSRFSLNGLKNFPLFGRKFKIQMEILLRIVFAYQLRRKTYTRMFVQGKNGVIEAKGKSFSFEINACLEQLNNFSYLINSFTFCHNERFHCVQMHHIAGTKKGQSESFIAFP